VHDAVVALIRQGAPREFAVLTAERVGMMSSGEQLIIDGRISAPAEDPLSFGGTPLSNDPRG
jgi:hypothetical protein